MKILSTIPVLMLVACGGLPGVGAPIGGGPGPIGQAGQRPAPQYGPYAVVQEPLIKNPLAPAVGIRELKIQTAVEVAPDRGTIGLTVLGNGQTYDAAANQIRKAFDDIKKTATGTGCGFKIGHYAPPLKVGENKWKGGGQAEVHVDVTGKNEDDRITLANGCFKPLREFLGGLKADDKATESYDITQFAIPPIEVWSVENLDKHRDALVKQADDRFKAVQKAEAKMWDHADVQCTSSGVVHVAASSSHAVVLTLEMVCPVSPAETASDPGTGRKMPK